MLDWQRHGSRALCEHIRRIGRGCAWVPMARIDRRRSRQLGGCFERTRILFAQSMLNDTA